MNSSTKFIFCLAFILSNGLLPANIDAQTTNQTAQVSKRPENFPANPKLPSLFIIGDSTVRNGSGHGDGGQWGWGDFLAPFFQTNKINVVNRALGGTSSRTFYRDQWPHTLAMLKSGDFVIMQFGHNDSSPINETVLNSRARSRGTIHGVGDETETITNIITKKIEVVHTFGWYMAQCVKDAKSKGAAAIICSPIPHKQRWENGRDFADIADWDEQVAKNNGALYFDLTMIVSDAYKKIGADKVETFFADKGTHTSDSGAQFNAACVVAGLKSLPGNPLGNFFSEKAADIEPYGATAEDTNILKFDFSAIAATDWTHVAPTNLYSPETGFGFEPGAEVVAEKNSLASTNAFYFSVKLPEGNYQITATLGGNADSTTTVKAELRRLMLEKIHVPAGKSETRTFIVNIRTPEIGENNHVHLKPRETTNEWRAWDEKLTLEFNGTNPGVRSLEIQKADAPTIFVIGDSTVCDQPAEPWNSWGQMLPRFFKPEIAIANHAESGETIANSLRAQRFEKIFSLMKKGDYLFVQFGHNDMKNHATNALDIYKSDLKQVVESTRKLGGTPVLITSMERKAGVESPTLMGYPDAVREVAKEENCELIDLNAMSLVFYKALGADLDKAFQDGTHHNNYGSYELAKCVVEGIKRDKLPLTKYVVDDFNFDPAHPDSVADFQMVASPVSSSAKPLGN